MATAAQQLSEWVDGLTYADIPETAREAGVRALIDTVGVGLASSNMPFADIVTGLITEWGGVAEGTVWATGARVPAPNAIIANGNMAHGIDFDDTHGEGLMHPSACVVPTALAVGEKVGASGEEVLTAIIAGIEVQTRIASAAAGMFHARGFHPTFVSGSFSTALTAGKLLGLTPEQLTHALGICGTQASGTFEWLQNGSWAKRFGPGWAGHSGTIAALLAARGYTGPETIFEGRFGLYRSHVGEGNYSIDRLLRGLGQEWETTMLLPKRYPCCHATHGAVNAAKKVLADPQFDLDAIEDVEVWIQPEMLPVVCQPEDVKRRPNSVYQALFSLYYVVARTLMFGHVDLDDFTEETIRDPKVLALSDKVRDVGHEPYAHHLGYPGTVIVRLRDGRELRGESDDLSDPITMDEVTDKFRRNARRVMSAEQVDELLESLRTIASASDIRSLMSLTVAQQAAAVPADD